MKNHHSVRNYEGPHREEFLDFVRKISPDADPLSVLVFGEIQRVSHHLTEAAERNLATAGLSWAKFRLLMNLMRQENCGRAEGIQPSELSEMQGISRNTVSALIGSLEKEGLITREPEGLDRRKFVIRLTPRGRRVVIAKLGDHFRFASRCFARMSRHDRDRLHQHLSELLTSLEQETQDGETIG